MQQSYKALSALRSVWSNSEALGGWWSASDLIGSGEQWFRHALAEAQAGRKGPNHRDFMYSR